MPQLGKLLGHIFDDQDTQRVGTKSLLQCLKGDVTWVHIKSVTSSIWKRKIKTGQMFADIRARGEMNVWYYSKGTYQTQGL